MIISKQMSQKYNNRSYIHENWSNITYLWVAKVCETLWVAVNCKVKLGIICFQSIEWQPGVSECPVLWTGIYQSLHNTCLWKCEKSLDSTNPLSDRLCTKRGHLRPLLPSSNNKDHCKSKMCNFPQGHKGTQGNF